MPRRPLAAFALFVLLGSLAGAHLAAEPPGSPSGPALVILVRHAEKAAEGGDDPALSTAGQARAQALVTALEHSGVTAVVTSQLRRTWETAAPLAAGRELEPEKVEVRRGEVEAHVQAVAAAVSRHAGGVVLVVGHSNTIPKIVTALGGPTLPDLCDGSYEDLFLLVPGQGSSPVRVVRAKYGAPSPC
ncbi:MAG TPA: histidine phosphatase family protein [Thermoanaerobaculia bacterium]|nr:histidine phosphatase family protein [Thermoanaerobaculia bacterium]